MLGPANRLFYDRPVHLVRGQGSHVFDVDGVRYLDAYNNVVSVGHCHPHVVDAVMQQMSTLNTHTRYLHRGIVDYSERLLATMPDEIDQVMYACTGSEVNDLALRVAGFSGTDRSDAALAWLQDVSSFQITGRLLSENQLSPDLSAVLTDFAGEAGRHPASIEEINRKLSTRAELENRLITENTIYLEDNSPAARVRALDWLKSRGHAPANFDPLGTPRQRRDALQASR